MSFKRLDPEDISISAESVVAPLWSTGDSILTSFFTSSTQVAGNLGSYFTDVYQSSPVLDANAQVQFSIAYGDRLGSGSAPYNINVTGSSPTSVVYGQYRSLILGDEDARFTFGTVASDKIFALTVDRARYKEKLLPGTFNIKLTSGSFSLNLTDNSNDVTAISYTDAGRVYDIVSGSNGNARSTNSGLHPTLGTYGKFLPDIGVIILNADALNTTTGGVHLKLTSGSLATEKNSNKLFSAILAGANTQLQSEETISSNYVFVRARNSEFNYSTNPSNITGSGDLRHNIMVNTPQSYVTTVGLYNDNNELLAVAKLSRALLKDFTKEALIRIKLDY